jgi:hypothetical protein
MAFWQQVIATLIGATSGFLFALMLFWIRERSTKKRLEKHLLKNLHYEFEYNLNLFRKYAGRISECIEAINAGDKNVYLSLDYNFVASFFSMEFYREGLASKYLHYENMKRWNDFLSNHSPGSEEYVLSTLESWRKSEIEKGKVFKALKHERNQLNYAIEMIEYLKQKIPS